MNLKGSAADVRPVEPGGMLNHSSGCKSPRREEKRNGVFAYICRLIDGLEPVILRCDVPLSRGGCLASLGGSLILIRRLLRVYASAVASSRATLAAESPSISK